MTKEIIKYHNNLNTVIMRNWTSEEMDFFFAIIAKAREKGSEKLIFDTDEIKKLVEFAQKDDKRWREVMKNCAKKVTQLTYFEDNGKKFEVMALFSRFKIDYDEKTAEVEVSKNFEYVLNRLKAQFTQYELAEFTNIRSTYAKTAYRLLKQWRTVGSKKFEIEEFKTLMAMPKSYKSSHIDRLVIKPILKELSQYFVGLKCKKHKSKKRGNPVLAYEFTWQAEITEPYDPDKYKKLKQAEQYKKPATKKKAAKATLPAWTNAAPLTADQKAFIAEVANTNIPSENWKIPFNAEQNKTLIEYKAYLDDEKVLSEKELAAMVSKIETWGKLECYEHTELVSHGKLLTKTEWVAVNKQLKELEAKMSGQENEHQTDIYDFIPD